MKKSLGDITCWTVGNREMTLREVFKDVKKGPPSGSSQNYHLRSTVEVRDTRDVEALLALPHPGTYVSADVMVRARGYVGRAVMSYSGRGVEPSSNGVLAPRPQDIFALIVPVVVLEEMGVPFLIEQQDREAESAKQDREAESAKQDREAESAKQAAKEAAARITRESLMPSPGKVYTYTQIVEAHRLGLFNSHPWLFRVHYFGDIAGTNRLDSSGWTEVGRTWTNSMPQADGPQPWSVGHLTGGREFTAIGPASPATSPAVASPVKPRMYGGLVEGSIIEGEYPNRPSLQMRRAGIPFGTKIEILKRTAGRTGVGTWISTHGGTVDLGGSDQADNSIDRCRIVKFPD